MHSEDQYLSPLSTIHWAIGQTRSTQDFFIRSHYDNRLIELTQSLPRVRDLRRISVCSSGQLTMISSVRSSPSSSVRNHQPRKLRPTYLRYTSSPTLIILLISLQHSIFNVPQKFPKYFSNFCFSKKCLQLFSIFLRIFRCSVERVIRQFHRDRGASPAKLPSRPDPSGPRPREKNRRRRCCRRGGRRRLAHPRRSATPLCRASGATHLSAAHPSGQHPERRADAVDERVTTRRSRQSLTEPGRACHTKPAERSTARKARTNLPARRLLSRVAQPVARSFSPIHRPTTNR